jgi:hypothetical protein
MNYQTISDVYEANDRVREKLKAVAASVSDEQASARPDGEKWTVAELVEHIAIVNEGMIRISAKLLGKAQASGAAASDGSVRLSETFRQQAAGARESKFEAPEMVRPKGGVTIAESLARLDENRARLEELRALFETVDCSEFKFPHPAFGELSAHDWLALLGGHEARHIEQIGRILAKIAAGDR